MAMACKRGHRTGGDGGGEEDASETERMFEAGTSRPQWSPFAVYPQQDAPQDEMISLVRELVALMGAEKRTPAMTTGSFSQWMSGNLDQFWTLGSGQRATVDAKRRARLAEIQETLDSRFPDYENYLFEMVIRRAGTEIKRLRRFIGENPEHSTDLQPTLDHYC